MRRNRPFTLLFAGTILLAGILPLASCGDDDDTPSDGTGTSTGAKNQNANILSIYPECSRLEVPHLKDPNTNLLLVHSTGDYGVNYIVEWDCQKKSQRWTAYTLTNENSVKNVSRYYSTTNQYPQDPDLPSAFRFASDPYWGSGYDHGHICPSYDRLCSTEANIQTFYLTNMQPQFNKFNAGLWLKMENIVSGSWNRYNFRDTLYVCKGGTIDTTDNLLTTTDKGMLVPKYFYMAVLCKNSQGYKAIAFWAQHLNSDHSNDNLYDYTISIDELEKRTGIDFFCNLPDDVEDKVERMAYPSAWGLKSN